MNRANVELAYVLATMFVLSLFGVAAVVVFFRVWRREQREKTSTQDENEQPSDGRK